MNLEFHAYRQYIIAIKEWTKWDSWWKESFSTRHANKTNEIVVVHADVGSGCSSGELLLLLCHVLGIKEQTKRMLYCIMHLQMQFLCRGFLRIIERAIIERGKMMQLMNQARWAQETNSENPKRVHTLMMIPSARMEAYVIDYRGW